MLGRYGGAWLARVGLPRVIIFFSIIVKIHTKFKKKSLKLLLKFPNGCFLNLNPSHL
ncbi:hypothetical protein HanXRQr2_Chr12g0545981 [Helianthus annuus]|uniref:Uncharacterized protein n=1 Tax=Helianthus annuus TaxID=4232 RepID=A0A9K3HH75_HELAN|nr:hypothetical protein HanXRQr2_Chr12g0545981 [Helianthus annuus]KAJ0863063.1 hypothetical protein HanPSC8_Chr12g0525591 [Helianthus annuus]